MDLIIKCISSFITERFWGEIVFRFEDGRLVKVEKVPNPGVLRE